MWDSHDFTTSTETLKSTRTQWHARPAHVYILLSLLFYFWKSGLYRLAMNNYGFFWTVSGRSSFLGYTKVDLYTHWSHSFDDISLWCVDFVENIFDQSDEMPYRTWLGLLCGWIWRKVLTIQSPQYPSELFFLMISSVIQVIAFIKLTFENSSMVEATSENSKYNNSSQSDLKMICELHIFRNLTMLVLGKKLLAEWTKIYSA